MAKEVIGTNNGQQFYVGGGAIEPRGPEAPVLRYTQPAAPTAPVPPPTPQTPQGGQNLPSGSVPDLLSADAFNAQRGGNVDEAAIREQTRKNMQAQIDATDAFYGDLTRREEQAGSERLDKVRAINVNSGLGGSSFATSADLTQRDKNAGAVKSIEAEKNMRIQEINGQIDKAAKEEIAAKKLEAVGNADAYTAYLEKARTQAEGQLSQLATAGVDLSQLDPSRRSYLFKSAGLDDSLGELVYNSMKPKASQVDYKAEKAGDGQILLYGVDPSTGQLKQQRIDFDVPEGYDPTYVDGQLYFKSQADGSLIPAPQDQSLYTPDYKNYLLSKKEGYAGDFNSWQTEDANRKRSVTNYSIGGSDLNTKDRAVFNSLVDKANKSPLIAAADRTIVLEQSVKDIKADPANAAKQLNLSYSYIQALDTYQSAVREGELANLNSIDSKIGNLQGEIQKIQNGQIVRPEVAKQIADAAEQIVKTIKEGAKAADKKYAAQAKVNGSAVEKAWNDYRGGFTASYDEPGTDDSNLSDEEAYNLYLQSQQ